MSHPLPPRVLIFPVPALGHVNSMLKLAELLSHAGIKITFLNTDYNHDRLTRHTDVSSRFPGFEFKTITDGLPMDHPRTGGRFEDVLYSVKSVAPPLLKELLIHSKPPVDCIISDGFMSFAIDVAEELGIPIIYFRTISACAFWAYFCIRDIIDAGELPIKGSEDMDRLIKSVPGMENFLRCRDLPSFCRAEDPLDRNIQLFMSETRATPRVGGVIFNTFEDLEKPILSQIRTRCPNLYTIGPLHAHLKARIPETITTSQTSNSFWEVDRKCLTWLDNQPKHSVIYVSFGSITVLSREQLLEFWHGLVDSNKRFLWVIRPDSIDDGSENQIPEDLVEGTKERGFMVSWVPQEEVLAHEAIGGFWTHSGWNSTLESIAAGVPMICWSYFADQQVNSRFVGEVWKLGLDMKDVCDRKVVEQMVNDLMVERREEFMRSADRMATLARGSVSEGGSSYCNLDRLINDIRLMSSQVEK